MHGRKKKLLWTIGTGLLIVSLSALFWVRRFHNYTPVEAVQDLKAAIASRNAPRPVENYLELRYGPLTEPANRQKAFLDFFNIGHIQGLQMIVNRMPAERREGSIAAMAHWVANYRRTMSPEEKQALRDYLYSGDGRATLEKATAQYLSQNVRYRAATAPVITELMMTLAELKEP